VIAYRATFDVPRETVQFTAQLLAAERRRRGTPRGSRALTCFWQAVPGLRWFRDRTSPDALARDHGISRATAYRYLDEVTEVLADQAPDLREALDRAVEEDLPHVVLDGTLIRTGRCREKTGSARGTEIDLWYCGKIRGHGGNIQAVLAPGRVPAAGLRRRAGLVPRHHRRPTPAATAPARPSPSRPRPAATARPSISMP
jgi:hypothetical protein